MSNTNIITVDTVKAKKLKFIEVIKERFPGIQKPMVSFTDLRTEDFLIPSKNSYTMKLKDVGAPTSELENRLEDGQLFCPIFVSVRIQKAINPKGGVSIETDANFPMFTYPDRNYFNGTDGTNFEATALEKIYQGHISMAKGGTNLVRNISTDSTKYVPPVQYSTAAVAGTTFDVYPQYGPSYEERGYYQIYNDIVLDGGEDNTTTLALGAGNITLIAGNDPNIVNKLVVSYKGFWFYGDDFGKSSGYCSTL